MRTFDLDSLVRRNIKNLKPYSSARSEYSGSASIFLDANENAFGSPLPENFNRYPDPLQWPLKQELSKIKGIPSQNIFIGNGSDEVIDLAYRIFCEPGKDNVIICPPTYGMYSVSGNVNDVQIQEAMLTQDFQLNVDAILKKVDSNTRLLFICSPNNPTGNDMTRIDVEALINNFPGLVIIDEAYINYSRQKSFLQELTEYENLIVMQTLSKAWGLAALRLGLCFASEKIIELFNKVKPPYNINKASQQLGRAALSGIDEVNKNIKLTVEQRDILGNELLQFNFIKKIYPSDSNFILIKANDAQNLYKYLSAKEIIVRNRSKEPLCENCLRITVGKPGENKTLIEALKNYKDE
ncbi:MAG TPA: histidinol-phosphate transaminase [Chitinophagaceae bacterium]|nr:histidinol-phosphate transaminase [Chitinophagaceae bacterium]